MMPTLPPPTLTHFASFTLADLTAASAACIPAVNPCVSIMPSASLISCLLFVNPDEFENFLVCGRNDVRADGLADPPRGFRTRLNGRADRPDLSAHERRHVG